MSTQMKLASDIPQARDVPGTVKGTIGDHPFETAYGKTHTYDGIVRLTLMDKHEEGGSEEAYIEFPDTAKAGDKLAFDSVRALTGWITFNHSPNPHALQLTQGVVRIDEFVLSPFKLKGNISATTESPAHSVNIDIDVSA